MSEEVELIKTTKKIVEKLLRKFPEYRDNDEKLVAHFWKYELIDLNKSLDKVSVMSFLKLYAARGVTPADYITRARRRLQENNTELQGKKWEDRHKKEKEVRKEIKNI